MSRQGRQLGFSGIEVPALGLGCWAIGGPYTRKGRPMGWGRVDDDQSIRAIHAALDCGIRFFDTADMYGCGHSESVLGKALGTTRADVVIASKFGYRFDASSKSVTGKISLPSGIEPALDASLERLRTDYIDLYQLHVNRCDPKTAIAVQDCLEWLADAGKIRAYGWSTDDPACVGMFEASSRFVAIQQALNVLQGNLDTLAASRARNLATICRSPLAMGILTGKWMARGAFDPDDLRSRWRRYDGAVAEMTSAVAEITRILRDNGRTLAQGALGWLWAFCDSAIPIPGFRTVDQVVENAGAIDQGPLARDQMTAIESLLTRRFPDNPWDLREAGDTV